MQANARKVVSVFCKKPESIDLMLELVQDELNSTSKENDEHLRTLFSKLQHAYSGSRPDSQVDYSSAFHLENPVFLRDIGANYLGYFNHDKNLLLDVCHQSTILDTLRENQLEKTSFPGGPCGQNHTTDGKQAKNPKASGSGSEDDMCYVCGHGDDEEDNKIVYCEVSFFSLNPLIVLRDLRARQVLWHRGRHRDARLVLLPLPGLPRT
jgi:hypothetical protein